MSDHIGRSWTEHPLEDACPCPQEACGLVAVSRIDPACHQHALAAGKTIRQSHTAERCPMTAPTSPKPRTPANLTESKDVPATLDNEAADAGLRTALTKLADKWDAEDDARHILFNRVPFPPECSCGTRMPDGNVRDNFNQHLADVAVPAPVSDTRREDVGVEAIARVLHSRDVTEDDLPEGSWGNAAVRYRYRAMADAVLAVLPAPPVVDEAEVRERIAQDIARAVGEGTASDIARGVTR